MKNSRLIFLPALMATVLICLACSGVPTESIQRTDKAKADAAAERAEMFAPDYWAAAEEALRDANAKIAAKSYGEAGALLLKAKTNYDRARELAKSKREAAIKMITERQTTINIRMKSDLKDNPAASKLAPARKKEFDAEVQSIEDSVLKVTEQLKNGQYSEADLLSQQTLRKIFETQQEFLKK
jgi:hypothetical protein